MQSSPNGTVGSVLQIFEVIDATKSGFLEVDQFIELLNLVEPSIAQICSESILNHSAFVSDGRLAYKDFLSWLFTDSDEPPVRTAQDYSSTSPTESPPCPKRSIESLRDRRTSNPKDIPRLTSNISRSKQELQAELDAILAEHPYLDEYVKCIWPHPSRSVVEEIQQCLKDGDSIEAAAVLRRLNAALEIEKQTARAAFARFDVDGSGKLEATEIAYVCAYLGWLAEEADSIDADKDGKVTFQEFHFWMGTMGGSQKLFERRREQINHTKYKCSTCGVAVGSRVRSHFWHEGKKSPSWREARILELSKGEFEEDQLKVQFGFSDEIGCNKRLWKCIQIVPSEWVESNMDDALFVSALQEAGILHSEQAYWSSFFPESEVRAVERLEACQRKALAEIRSEATMSHAQALPGLQDRFAKLGWDERALQSTLDWVQDLAPIIIHVDIDSIGSYLEVDDFYRNQFETNTSCGFYDKGNTVRKGWEKDLFGCSYDDAKPFQRPKYGCLNVTNDFRGCKSAWQYGDSYLVLKDVRLRCTFASQDSGGIKSSRLGVLDKYAHTLAEYNDDELREIVAVSCASMSEHAMIASLSPTNVPCLLRGASNDSTKNWITVGYNQKSHIVTKGRYYFEVHLSAGCSCAQVGVLSTQFVLRPGVDSAEGVGDDEHGWALDFQHAARWHNGRALPWNDVVSNDSAVEVGVAVDLEDLKIWFTCDGQWDEQFAFPIKEGLELYPAVSLHGGGAFVFGPSSAFRWKHAPVAQDFVQWPGTFDGLLCIDCPHVGKSDVLKVYKEAQIHGEVNLKFHVQRLVANSKYRVRPKSRRSLSIQVSHAGCLSGQYERIGAHDKKPRYRSEQGANIYWKEDEQLWLLTDGDDFGKRRFSAAADLDADDLSGDDPRILEPPRLGWHHVDLSDYGYVNLEVFKAALSGLQVSEANMKELIGPLSGKDCNGTHVVFRRKEAASFDDFWESLPVTQTAEEAWKTIVSKAQQMYMEQAGYPHAIGVETDHPYPAKRVSWTREVYVEGAVSLNVRFSPHCVTFDSSSRLQIFGGGLERSCAGPGARVEVQARHGATFHGTLKNIQENGGWKVLLDQDALENSSLFRTCSKECYAIGFEEHSMIRVHYSDGVCVRDELVGFQLDPSYPLSPIRIEGLVHKAPGTASLTKMAGVREGWALDLKSTFFGESREKICRWEGRTFEDIDDVFNDLHEVHRRLQALLDSTDIVLYFKNGLTCKLLPEAYVTYMVGEKVGDEISGFTVDDYGLVSIAGFAQREKRGPAYTAGVGRSWTLKFAKTLRRNPGLGAPDMSEEELACNPNDLLEKSGITLVFMLRCSQPVRIATLHGNSWPDCKVYGSSARFQWTTDGDGGGYPERRWGFFAVVVPSFEFDDEKTKDVHSDLGGQSDVITLWNDITRRVQGAGSTPSVEKNGWEEARLRSLCDKHGWKFTWMTEDSERYERMFQQEKRAAGLAECLSVTVRNPHTAKPDGFVDLMDALSPKNYRRKTLTKQ